MGAIRSAPVFQAITLPLQPTSKTHLGVSETPVLLFAHLVDNAPEHGCVWEVHDILTGQSANALSHGFPHGHGEVNNRPDFSFEVRHHSARLDEQMNTM